MAVTVYGASDDLVEIEGDIYEEFTFGGGAHEETRGDLLAFSDGTVLRITYTAAGVWRIAPVVRGTSALTIEQAPEDDNDNYSDRATLTGLTAAVAWVVQGHAMAALPGTRVVA